MHWRWLALLLTVAATLATWLQPAFRQWSRRKAQAQGVIEALMGDSRRLFANHFFIQSDVYLHGGYYPSIFDQTDDAGKTTEGHSEALHSADQEHEHDEHCQHDFLGKPRNWLDAVGRNFYPSRHTHLGEGPGGGAEVREILPWIRLSAELDPQREETYTVGAYWLREMGRPDEAIQFLREGLRAIPASCEILYELGACYEDKKDPRLARNLWELAFRRWRQQHSSPSNADRLMAAQILTRLARLEARENRRDQAVAWLELLTQYSTNPGQVRKRIEEVKAGLPFEAEKKQEKK